MALNGRPWGGNVTWITGAGGDTAVENRVRHDENGSTTEQASGGRAKTTDLDSLREQLERKRGNQ